MDFQSVSSWDILPALGTVKAACIQMFGLDVNFDTVEVF